MASLFTRRLLKALLLLCIVSLSGCAVGNMDSTDYQFVNYAQTFQKPATIGSTDTAQRKADLYSCGIDKNANLEDGSYSPSTAKPGETLQTVVARRKNIESCMKDKGYVIISYGECGPVKAPTGKCN